MKRRSPFAPRVEYPMAERRTQVAIAVDELGLEGVLLSTGQSCEDSCISAALKNRRKFCPKPYGAFSCVPDVITLWVVLAFNRSCCSSARNQLYTIRDVVDLDTYRDPLG